ncbi:hypothetical protein ACFVTX_06330 [Agromyces sp. NPDC058136]|uniref:hypothetical protein n=1 Tax=Agromyces sp. NPDC058136 TaxID=3346354 RepID=UPI0036D8C1D7
MTTKTNLTTTLLGSAVLVTAVVGLTGCSAIDEVDRSLDERGAGHTVEVRYETGSEGLADERVQLPGWVPAGASEITEKVRTTGSERLLRLKADASMLAEQCEAWPVGTAPQRPAEQNTFGEEITYLDAPTMRASWWSDGIELASSLVCGETWWVAESDGWVYAFSPERQMTEIEEASTLG